MSVPIGESRIYSCDDHLDIYHLPRDLWARRLPAKYRESGPHVVERGGRHWWLAGDRMKPLGMNGSKKLQDIFVDARVPSETRARIPVFVCRGEIIWLPGYRVARGWEVRDPEDPAVQLHIDECAD